MAANLNLTHDDLYAEVRAYLLALFALPSENVIRGYSNNVPLPNGTFILMNILSERALATNAYDYNKSAANVEILQSSEIQMQLDFYGEGTGALARTFCTLWRDFYGCEHLSCCQPLYCDDARFQPFTNEAQEYEERWIVTASLNYNPVVTHDQDFITQPDISIQSI